MLPDDSTLTQALDEGELNRFAGIRKASRQRQFLAGHSLVRQLACERFGGSLIDWRWVVNDLGKPSLQRQSQSVCVSISHSGNWLAGAVAAEPIGIDVEVSTRERDWSALGAYTFPLNATPDWCELPPSEQKANFLNWWCLHEARGKRNGNGIEVSEMRQLRVLPCMHTTLDAISWPLSDGFLAIAGAAHVVLRGCNDRRSWWRFEETTKLESCGGRG